MPLIEAVIGELRKANQRLVFLDSLCCNVRNIVPGSERDQVMRDLIADLKRKGIIEEALGFMSLAKSPPYFYATSFHLTDHFFRTSCLAFCKQLNLFS